MLFDNEDQTGIHPRRRKVGFVFQHYALFRRLTVFENVAFGLRVKPRAQRPSKDEIRRVERSLDLDQIRLEIENDTGKRGAIFEIHVPFESFDKLKSGDTVYFRPRSFRTFLGEGV